MHAKYNTKISGKKLLKYWFKNSKTGPNNPKSVYPISLFDIWAICNGTTSKRHKFSVSIGRFCSDIACDERCTPLTTSLFVTLAAYMPNVIMYSDGYVSNTRSTDFCEMINASTTTVTSGTTGDRTLVPCQMSDERHHKRDQSKTID